MTKLSVDDMLNGKSNKYPLAVAVAKRAREITGDANLYGEILEEKPVNIAIREFENHEYIIEEPD
jgi:DNA-directed RNA polymerase omega subunit